MPGYDKVTTVIDKAVSPAVDLCYARAMLKQIKAFLDDLEGEEDAGNDRYKPDELQVATAALMVEAARLDGQFEADEQSRITALLEGRFALAPEDVSELIEAATTAAEDAVELYGFVHKINGSFDHEERIKLVEMLWDVAYADGELHPFEANLLRRVAGLLYVTDQESGAARKRVLGRRGAADGS